MIETSAFGGRWLLWPRPGRQHIGTLVSQGSQEKGIKVVYDLVSGAIDLEPRNSPGYMT